MLTISENLLLEAMVAELLDHFSGYGGESKLTRSQAFLIASGAIDRATQASV
jgi:hypothetical protein